MAKSIAVVVRNSQAEALRMAVGLILQDDIVHFYALDRKVEDTEQNRLNLQTMSELDISAYTNSRDNRDMTYMPTRDIAQKLLEYDHILMY